MSPFVHHLEAHVPWGGTGGAPEIPQKDEAPRTTATYVCAQGHTRTLSFALGAEIPAAWDCRHCGQPARLEGAPEDAGASTRLPAYPQVGSGKYERDGTSPWEQLMKRRSREDGEALLAERLAALRAQRMAS